MKKFLSLFLAIALLAVPSIAFASEEKAESKIEIIDSKEIAVDGFRFVVDTMVVSGRVLTGVKNSDQMQKAEPGFEAAYRKMADSILVSNELSMSRADTTFNKSGHNGYTHASHWGKFYTTYSQQKGFAYNLDLSGQAWYSGPQYPTSLAISETITWDSTYPSISYSWPPGFSGSSSTSSSTWNSGQIYGYSIITAHQVTFSASRFTSWTTDLYVENGGAAYLGANIYRAYVNSSHHY